MVHRQTKVNCLQLGVLVGALVHKVVGLDVAVYDVLRMALCQGAQHAPRHRRHVLLRVRHMLLNPGEERAAVCNLHHHVDSLGVFKGVVEPDAIQAAYTDAVHDVNLKHQVASLHLIRQLAFVNHLYRHTLASAQVPTQNYHAIRSTSQHSLRQFIVTVEICFEPESVVLTFMRVILCNFCDSFLCMHRAFNLLVAETVAHASRLSCILLLKSRGRNLDY
mmetsp:Transcript_8357/g.15839  ORF Transcript_8357/g.15839 Transcript_8357/m.15839 type:complete len:220 (-) Transcript_8357:150-809(-)